MRMSPSVQDPIYNRNTDLFRRNCDKRKAPGKIQNVFVINTQSKYYIACTCFLYLNAFLEESKSLPNHFSSHTCIVTDKIIFFKYQLRAFGSTLLLFLGQTRFLFVKKYILYAIYKQKDIENWKKVFHSSLTRESFRLATHLCINKWILSHRREHMNRGALWCH